MDRVRLDEIARRHGVVLLVEFGSSAGGARHPRSDRDVGVLFAEAPRSWADVAELTHELTALLPDRALDLAVLNHADPLFLRQVTQRCRLLHGSPTRFQEFLCHAFRRYQDHRRYLAPERDYVDRVLGPVVCR